MTKSPDGGFTLIEVMMAMAIFTIGVLAVFALQTNSMNRSNSAVKSNQAGFWAQDKVEDLMRLPYDDAQLDTVSSDSLGLGKIHTATEGPYNLSWVVFSDDENDTMVNDYTTISGDPIFAKSDKVQDVTNLRANTKIVMIYASHPLGEESRLVFIKPNI